MAPYQRPDLRRSLWQLANTFVPFAALWAVEDAYWAEHEGWDYAAAALQGSSYLKLPRVLQWFTGNIGLHHIHHLSARIPNYALQRCHDENPQLHAAHVLTLSSGMRTLSLSLWDEAARRMISFRQ